MMIFLKKVYRYNKWMFGGMLFFMLVQLFCFYKGGMVFSPWFNYGMYSAKAQVEKSYPLMLVYPNGSDSSKPLQGSQFFPQDWDKIYLTNYMLYSQTCNSSFFQNEVDRIGQKAGIKFDSKKFSIAKEEEIAALKTWMTAYLSTVANSHSVMARCLRASFDGGKFHLTNSPTADCGDFAPCKSPKP